MIIQKYTCTPVFIAALFTITRYRNNLNEWIKMCYVHIQWNTSQPSKGQNNAICRNMVANRDDHIK